jgi:phosphatidate cytidylyltransferase
MKREASALVAIPVVVAAVFLPDRELFRWIVTALSLVALWEYVSLCRLEGLLSAAVLAGGAFSVSAAYGEGGLFSPGAALLLVLVASLWKVEDPAESFRRSGEAVLGAVYISFAFTSLLLLRELPGGSSWIMVLLIILWAGDTAAYYGGSRFGRRKLAPSLSPKKTWEGAAAGLLGSLVAGTVTAMLLLDDLPLDRVAVLTLAVAASGQVGDLLESLWKRAKGVKDSGRIMPGHGGLLDRIDSLLLGAPVGYQLIRTWVTGA